MAKKRANQTGDISRHRAEPIPEAEQEDEDDAIEIDERVAVLPPESFPDDSSEEEEEIEVAKNVLPSVKRVRSDDVAPYDSFSAYLKEIQQYPHLTREEEHELAVQYKNFQDLDAAYRLVTSNLWLVVKIAKEYEAAARNLLDLVQEGNIGLMESVKHFDPYRGVRFPSYAVWWIKAYIIRYVMANIRMVKVGTTQAQRKLFFNLQREKEKLEREGFYPGPRLLAEKLNVKEREVVEMEQRLSAPDLSVDAPLQSDADGDLHSVLPASGLSAEELLSRKQIAEMISSGIEEFSATLKDKELVIFKERMLSEEKATLQELSEKLSLSRERIRQLENRVRDKLKGYLVERFGANMDQIDF